MILIHHDKDLDGMACRAIFEKMFPDADIIGWDYKYDHDRLIQRIDEAAPERIIMADVTLPYEHMSYLNDNYDLTVVDHHEQAWKALGPLNIDYVFGKLSACEHLWAYLFHTSPPRVLELLGKYDTWREEGSHEWVNDIIPFQLYMSTKFGSEAVRHLIESPGDVDEHIQMGRVLVSFEEGQFKMISSQMIEVDLLGEKFMAVNATVNPGRLMNFVRDQYGYERIVVYYQGEDRRWHYSLRGTVTINHIAKHYGGGGHPKAAGFVDEDLIF